MPRQNKQPPADLQGFIYKNTTYVPLRFLSESLGKPVGWDDQTSSIFVGDKPQNWPPPSVPPQPTGTSSLQVFPKDNPWNTDISSFPIHQRSKQYLDAIGLNTPVHADFGTEWDLKSNATRPKYWTSADAAGLPILPGLVRYEEAVTGEINHALRFTVRKTQGGFIAPATHFASSSTDSNLPPMGLRIRLRADFDISSYSTTNQAILRAMKKYGMIVADNGSNLYVSGAPDPNWDDDDLHKLGNIKGSDFEVVDTGPIEK